MNSKPNAAQKKFQDELREMGWCPVYGSGNDVEIDHVVGAKAKTKVELVTVQVGEWWVLSMTANAHRLDPINKTAFQKQFCDNWREKGERDIEVFKRLYGKMLRAYEVYYGKPHPVPKEVIKGIKEWK